LSDSWYRPSNQLASSGIDWNADLVDEIKLDDDQSSHQPAPSYSDDQREEELVIEEKRSPKVAKEVEMLTPRSPSSNNQKSSASILSLRYDISNAIRETLAFYLNKSTMLAGNAINRAIAGVKENPWVANATGCAAESMLFAVERARYVGAAVGHVATLDDPETQHLKFISDGLHGGGWKEALRLRDRHSSLTLEARDLIDYRLSTSSDDVHASSQIVATYRNTESNSYDDNLLSLAELAHLVDSDDPRHAHARARAAVSSVSYASYGHEDEDDNASLDSVEEAGYILTKAFTSPPFKENNHCYLCVRDFNIACFRHHCRNCGESCCNDHSRHRRRILQFAITIPVRVCDNCVRQIDQLSSQESLIWKQTRVRDYLASNLRPYRPPKVDRHVDKLHRIADYSLQFIKKSLILSYPTLIALETLDILKR
jgi:hypothetical protein